MQMIKQQLLIMLVSFQKLTILAKVCQHHHPLHTLHRRQGHVLSAQEAVDQGVMRASPMRCCCGIERSFTAIRKDQQQGAHLLLRDLCPAAAGTAVPAASQAIFICAIQVSKGCCCLKW